MSKVLFGDLLAKADPIKTPVNGEIVSGIVVSANQKMIIVDIGNGQFTGVIAGTHMTSSTEDAGNLSA